MSGMMRRYYKSRVDGLTDGVFAFAMTLLVLDVRFETGLPINSASDLMVHLVNLAPRLLTYLISFFVLGAHWRGTIELRPSGEHLSAGLVTLWMFYLFFVTMVPFSSSVVGKYGEFAPAVFVYSANMIALGILHIAWRYFEAPHGQKSLSFAAGAHLPLVIIAALVSIIVSLFDPRQALYAYALTFLSRTPWWPAPTPPPVLPVLPVGERKK